MAFSGTAVLLHLQKFWIVSVESSVFTPWNAASGAKMTLERHLSPSGGVKLALERQKESLEFRKVPRP